MTAATTAAINIVISWIIIGVKFGDVKLIYSGYATNTTPKRVKIRDFISMVLKKHYHLKDDEKLSIIVISDTHIGSEQFNNEYFDYACETFHDIPGYKRMYTTGDLWESASKRVGNSAFHTEMTLDEQLDYSLTRLLPFHKDFKYAVVGNHEARLEQD